MLFPVLIASILALIGVTPSAALSNKTTTLDLEGHGLNHTIVERDRPMGYFGPIRGRQYQVRVNAYRNDKGGCSWPVGREKNFMGGINIDMDGLCKNFNFKHHDLTELISMSLPNRWLFPETKHCEVAFFQQYKCKGLLMGFLTERDARVTETNCFELLGAYSSRAVCGETWWDIWQKGGTPWLDPNSPWFLNDHSEWLLDASAAVFGHKKYFKHCNPGDIPCILQAASSSSSKDLQIHDRDGSKRAAWFEKMRDEGKALDFSREPYRECDWNGRCGMWCPKEGKYRVLCDPDLRKTPKGEEFPYDQAWEIASPALPRNTVGNQRLLGGEPDA